MVDQPRTYRHYSARHVRFGWWSFLVFATFGLVLELLQGFKVSAYLDVGNETRRSMWTLAHAHGTLLSLVHVLFGLSVRALPDLSTRRQRLISTCLTWATLVLPGGFFLGGIVVYSGNPGLGVALVPAGAILLMTAVYLIARASGEVDMVDEERDEPPGGSPPEAARAGKRPSKRG